MPPHFDLFLVLLIEFFSRGSQVAFINDKHMNISLFGGLEWLCKLHSEEADMCGLSTSTSSLRVWIAKEVQLRFWCPEVDSHVEFPIPNERLIWFGANATKHNLLRLSRLLEKLESYCVSAGYGFAPQELLAVLNSMIGEIHSRLEYHSTYLLELMGRLFYALNNLITRRFESNPTNRTSDMIFPEGLTSEVFRDMYGSVLVFKRYSKDRIENNIPSTTKYLKLRYQ